MTSATTEDLLVPMAGPAAPVVVVVLVLLLIAMVTAVRVVPEHERLVVARLGRVARVVGPGLVRRVPGVERWTTVSLRPEHLRLGVTATTRDGVTVHVRAEAQAHVTDPARAVVATEDPMSETVGSLESHLAREVAATLLPDLLAARRDYESALPSLVTGAASAWGVEVLSLDVRDIEVLLTADLLHAVRGAEQR